MSRLEYLKHIFKSMGHRDDLGIVFVVAGEDDSKSPYLTHPDGSISVPMKALRRQIPLPSSDIDTWNESSCASAFYELAQTSSRESYPDSMLFFQYIELPYDEFIGWLNRRGSTVPKFWQPSIAVTAKNQLKVKSSSGAKPNWDWGDIEMFVQRELDNRGDFEDPQFAIKRWRSYSDVYRLIVEYVERLVVDGGPGTGPALSTLKIRKDKDGQYEDKNEVARVSPAVSWNGSKAQLLKQASSTPKAFEAIDQKLNDEIPW